MNTVISRSTEYDEGLRTYMLGIYNYMFLGLLVSAVSAWIASATGFTAYLVSNTVLFIAMLLAPFGLIFAMAGAEKMKTATMLVLYLIFTLIEGLTLSVILEKYVGDSIALTLLTAGGVFAGLSLFGYSTKRDLSGWGTFLIGSLIGIIVLMILNLFVQSSWLAFGISLAGVLLFSGLIAYDTQKLKSEYINRAFIGGSMEKAKIWGALDLYLDFLNLFLFLLRILGITSDD